MLLSNYQFRFSVLGTVMAFLGIIIFFSLGSWQVLRSIEKSNLQDNFDTQSKLPPFSINQNLNEIQSKIYQAISAEGHFDSANEILIENIIYQGSAGYYVYTPLKLSNSNNVIIVNRGWIPSNKDRNILPSTDITSKEVIISGSVMPHRSKPPLILGKPDTESKSWLYFDEETFKKKSGYNVMPVIIQLDSKSNYGYTRDWPKYDAKVGMHIGYAIQWYVFAIIVLITYIALNLKKKNYKDK